MRLSDIKGDRAIDVIADLIEPVSNIATDDMSKGLFERRECPAGMTPEQFTLERIKKNAPKLLKSHKDDLVSILSTIGGIPKEQYVKDMTLASVMVDIIELFSDSEFLGFLSQAVSQNGSGSTSESTEV